MKNSKNYLYCIMFVVVLTGASLAQAAERDSYMGISLGNASPDSEVYDRALGWGLFGGHRVNRYFGLEGAYLSLGEMDGPVNGVYGATSLSTTAFAFSAIASYPFARRFAVYGKLGLLVWDSKCRKCGITGGTITSGDSNLSYGLGGRFDLSDSLGFLASWDRYPVDTDVDVLSASVYWRF